MWCQYNLWQLTLDKLQEMIIKIIAEYFSSHCENSTRRGKLPCQSYGLLILCSLSLLHIHHALNACLSYCEHFYPVTTAFPFCLVQLLENHCQFVAIGWWSISGMGCWIVETNASASAISRTYML